MKPIEPLTEEEMAAWPKSVVVDLEPPFVDDRGAIQPLVDTDMKSVVLISSKPGAVRADHYHKTDWHYCYMHSGSMEYYHRPVGSTAQPEMVIVKAGQMAFTPPMVEHAMHFLEDSVFVTMSRNPRDQETYEADVVRVGSLLKAYADSQTGGD